jgi:competence protein ComEA
VTLSFAFRDIRSAFRAPAPATIAGVHSLSRSQLLVYGALGVAVLLLGARWINSDDAGGVAQAGGVAYRGGESGIRSAGGSDGGGGELVVHVAGAVNKPGVYRLPAGSRVTDAVDRAGGMTGDANQDGVNLAAQLADGQQVVIPGEAAAVAGGAAGASAGDGPISLGAATVEQLDTIEGIGPVTAQNIVDFRSQNGGISSVEDLDRIPGIGPVTMEALRAAVQP